MLSSKMFSLATKPNLMAYRPTTFSAQSHQTNQIRWLANKPSGNNQGASTNTGAKSGAPSATPDGSSVRLTKEMTTPKSKGFDTDDIIQGEVKNAERKIESAAKDVKNATSNAAKDAKEYVHHKAEEMGIGSAKDAKKVASNAAESAKNTASNAASTASGAAATAKDYVQQKADQVGLGSVEDAKKTVSNAAESAKKFVEDKIGGSPTEKVMNMAKDAKEYAAEMLHVAQGDAASVARNAYVKATDAKDSVSHSAEHLMNQAKSAARDASSGAAGSTGSTVDAVVGVVKGAAYSAAGAASTAASKVADMAQGGTAEKIADAAKNAVGSAKSTFNSVTGGTFTDEVPMAPGKDDSSRFDHKKTGAEASNPNVSRADELYVENEKKKTGKKDNNPEHI